MADHDGLLTELRALGRSDGIASRDGRRLYVTTGRFGALLEVSVAKDLQVNQASRNHQHPETNKSRDKKCAACRRVRRRHGCRVSKLHPQVMLHYSTRTLQTITTDIGELKTEN